MSDFLGILIAAASASHGVQAEPELNAVSISIPAVDGLRGVGASYERFLPERKLSIAGLADIRQTATGDYGAVSAGVGGEVRWYWRSNRKAWLSKLPAGSMAGWFLGARLEAAFGATHDRVDDRWIGESLDIGVSGLVGYRIAPWRKLEITPTLGIGGRHQIDLSGRLPSYNRKTAFAGLSVGWLF